MFSYRGQISYKSQPEYIPQITEEERLPKTSRRSYHRWGIDEEVILIKLWEDEWTYHEIMKRFGFTMNMVTNKIAKMRRHSPELFPLRTKYMSSAGQ